MPVRYEVHSACGDVTSITIQDVTFANLWCPAENDSQVQSIPLCGTPFARFHNAPLNFCVSSSSSDVRQSRNASARTLLRSVSKCHSAAPASRGGTESPSDKGKYRTCWSQVLCLRAKLRIFWRQRAILSFRSFTITYDYNLSLQSRVVSLLEGQGRAAAHRFQGEDGREPPSPAAWSKVADLVLS